MTAQPEAATEPRTPLSRDRVLRAAVDLADREGLPALTMRNLAAELGVEAMSLYYHVANKEEVLDGIVDYIGDELFLAASQTGHLSEKTSWKTAMRQKILAARQVLLRHPWAPGVIETRTRIGFSTARHFDSLVELFRAGGFSYDLAHHAMHALGSRALGFTQELFDPDEQAGGGDDSADLMTEMAGQLPNLVGMLSEIVHDDPESTLGWCDDQTEFEFGLDLILDGLELRARA